VRGKYLACTDVDDGYGVGVEVEGCEEVCDVGSHAGYLVCFFLGHSDGWEGDWGRWC
jgi:hypothetical protein